MSISRTRSARSLAACGSLLVVDASQGVEAQTLANVYTCRARDRAGAEQDRPAGRNPTGSIEDVIGLDASEALLISAETRSISTRCSKRW